MSLNERQVILIYFFSFVIMKNFCSVQEELEALEAILMDDISITYNEKYVLN